MYFIIGPYQHDVNQATQHQARCEAAQAKHGRWKAISHGVSAKTTAISHLMLRHSYALRTV